MRHRGRIQRLEGRLTTPVPVEAVGFFAVTELSAPGRQVRGSTWTGQKDFPGHGQSFTQDELDLFMAEHQEFTGVLRMVPVLAGPDGRPEGPWERLAREAKEEEGRKMAKSNDERLTSMELTKVSKSLGHSSVSITASTYVHLELSDAALDSMED